MINKKFMGVLGIVLKPLEGVSQAKTVTPRIHVSHDASASCTFDVVGEQNLQVAHSRFLKIVTARIAVEAVSTRTIHTDDVTGFVQERVQRCVLSDENRSANNTRLRIAPETAAYLFTSALHNKLQPESCKEGDQDTLANVIDGQDIAQSVEICFSTMRTRSSTMASRSRSCSRALPSTSVVSYV